MELVTPVRRARTGAMLLRPLLPVLGIVALLFATQSAQASVLDPVGPVGAAQRTILINAVLIMLAIVVPTIVATLTFAWWYRASNTRAKRHPDFAYSGRVELVTWSIPVMVILFLGGITWVGSHELDPYKPIASEQPPLEVQVVSLDWKWLFILPTENVAMVNQLVIPVGRPLAIRLTSASVMNTFFVPRLGSMIYTMNGMTTQLHLQADQPGTFEGLSGHFSGDGFSGMRFQVRALDGAGFANWVSATKTAGDVLDRAAYQALAKQSSDVAPFTYRAAEAGLFDAVVRRTIPPAAGPDGGKGGPGVSPRSAAASPPSGAPGHAMGHVAGHDMAGSAGNAPGQVPGHVMADGASHTSGSPDSARFAGTAQAPTPSQDPPAFPASFPASFPAPPPTLPLAPSPEVSSTPIIHPGG